jgi:CBS domain-containing protein
MLAKEIMTTNVITISPDLTVSGIAALLLKKRISAVPVVDSDHRIVGMVSEGDLLHRPESGTEKRRGAWWLNLVTASGDLAADYTKSHGARAADVMTTEVVTVPDDMPVDEIARTLEEHHIKRVPVVRDGRLVGIVSRANLLHGLATGKQTPMSPSAAPDQAIRDNILHTLKNEEWANLTYANVTVEGGVAHLWGMAETDAQIKALEVAVGNSTGVTEVKNHMSGTSRFMYYGE